MHELAFPWITITICLPALGAALLVRQTDQRRTRLLAASIGLALLLICLGLQVAVHTRDASGPWLDPLAGGALGLDDLNAPLLTLTALLTLVASLGSPVAEANPSLLSVTFLVSAATLAALTCLHPLGFALAWAAGLLPVGVALYRRGARNLLWVFSISQAVGWVGLLVALSACAGGLQEGRIDRLSINEAGALALGSAIVARQGLLPLHSWLPALVSRGPAGLTLTCFAPQLGAYLLLRALSNDTAGVHETIRTVAACSAVYGACLGLVQSDLRRAIGWLCLSQSALVVAGLASTTPSAVSGALLLWSSSGLALAGLILAVAVTEARFGAVDLERHRGLAGRAPVLGGAFLLLGLASVGLPGSLGFVGEDLLFHGALEASIAVGIGLVLATALNGLSVIRLYFLAFQGARPALPEVPDIRGRERLVLIGLVLALLGAGVFPHPLVERSSRTATALFDQARHRSSP